MSSSAAMKSNICFLTWMKWGKMSLRFIFICIILVLLDLHSIQKQSYRGVLKKVFLKNFAKFTRKHLSCTFFLRTASNFIKVKTPTLVFLWVLAKVLKIFLLTGNLPWMLLSVTRCKNKNTMGSLFNGKYSQWGYRFLPITEAYLEPSQKSRRELFFENS